MNLSPLQRAALNAAVGALNLFLAAMDEPYRVTADKVTNTRRGGVAMFAFQVEPRKRKVES
jgi:hypothetical protein